MTTNFNTAVWRQGRVWISAIGLVTAVAGWFFYDAMMAPRWMRDFGLDMGVHATIVSYTSEETAFSTMRGRAEPENPYICLTRSAAFSWDRVFFIPSGGPLPEALAQLDWGGENTAELNNRLARDSRYQVIAFERDGQVVEFEYYFTMWADLSALARPGGLSRSEAVFTAESDGETFTVLPIASVGSVDCSQ